jgi:hypothetical protein
MAATAAIAALARPRLPERLPAATGAAAPVVADGNCVAGNCAADMETVTPLSSSSFSSSSSLRRSVAVWYLRDGSLARLRRMIFENPTGSFGLRSVIERGVSLRIDEMMETFVSPLKGRSPVAISWSITPSEKMSLR